MKQNGMSGACSRGESVGKCMQNSGWKTWREKTTQKVGGY